MVFALVYSVISTIILYLLYLFISKKWNRFVIKKPLKISVINFVLSTLFLVLFLAKPAYFQSNTNIENTFLFVMFSIFAVYFYVLIIPISGVHIITSFRGMVYHKSIKKYALTLLSIVTIGIIIYLSVNIF